MIVGHQQIDCHQIPKDAELVDRLVEHPIRSNVEVIRTRLAGRLNGKGGRGNRQAKKIEDHN